MEQLVKKFQDMLIQDISDHLDGLNQLMLSEVPDPDWVEYHHIKGKQKLQTLQEVMQHGI